MQTLFFIPSDHQQWIRNGLLFIPKIIKLSLELNDKTPTIYSPPKPQDPLFVLDDQGHLKSPLPTICTQCLHTQGIIPLLPWALSKIVGLTWLLSFTAMWKNLTAPIFATPELGHIKYTPEAPHCNKHILAMPCRRHAYHSMRLAKKATSIPMAGARTEGTIENPALVGAGAGAWALAKTATLDMTARMTTAEFTMLLDAIFLSGLWICIKTTQEISHKFKPQEPLNRKWNYLKPPLNWRSQC